MGGFLLQIIAAMPALLAGGLLMAAGGWFIAISFSESTCLPDVRASRDFFVFPILVPRRNHVLPNAAREAIPCIPVVRRTLFSGNRCLRH